MITVPRIAPEQAPTGAENVRFVLKTVDLTGNTVYSADALAGIWKEKIGQTITLAEAYRFATEITKRYRDDGYILSVAIVPKQEIKEGHLQLQVTEGYIANVAVEGDLKDPERLQAYAEKLKAKRPATAAALERYLLLINDLGGVVARSYLQASKTPNASDLTIRVNRAPPSTVLSAHNRASSVLGPQRLQLSTTWNDLFGLFERHNLTVLSTADAELNLISYFNELPLGSEGLKQQLSFSYSHSEPDVTPEFENEAIFASYRLAYPLVRSRKFNVYVNGGLAFYNGETDQLGVQFSEDRVRSFKLGTSFDYLDRLYGLNLFDLEYSRGIDLFNASQPRDPNLSRTNGDTEFNKFTAYAARLQSLAPRWSVLLAASGQYSDDILVPAEQFGLGGDYFVRAFNPSELIGDSGFAGKIELRYNLEAGPYVATLYLYQDGGFVSQNSLTGGTTEQSALATGVGVRATFFGWLSGFFEIAKPEGQDVFDQHNRDVRLFGGAAVQF